jgi:hypothetical protein
VFPRQGHYAHDPRELAAWPSADVTLESIEGLVDLPDAALGGARAA